MGIAVAHTRDPGTPKTVGVNWSTFEYLGVDLGVIYSYCGVLRAAENLTRGQLVETGRN